MAQSTPRTELEGAVALVTGGGSGIGAALVSRLASAGASVVAADVDAAGLAAVAAATGCTTLEVDVSDEQANDEMVEATVRDHGGLDLAFLNAGILGRPIAEQAVAITVDGLDVDRYRSAVGVNLDGVVYGTIACARVMQAGQGGAIVATASVAGLIPWGPDPFYTATKHAVVGWVRAIAPALAPSGVTVDAICPGGVATPMTGLDAADPLRDDVLRADQVAEAMVDTALEEETGRAVSVVAGRDPVRLVHAFNPVEGFFADR